MKSFEDSWKENRHVFESTKNLAKAMYLDGQQSKQSEVDELQKRVDEALREMKHQLGDEGYYDMQRPDYDAMMYSLRNIKDILKGDQS